MADEKTVKKNSPTVQLKKDINLVKQLDNEFVTKRGVKVRFQMLPTAIILKARRVPTEPDIPTYTDENGKQHENPSHPDYIKAMERYYQEQSNAVLDTMIDFGVELVDPLPSDDRWLRKMKRTGIIPTDVDLEDDLELEYWYKQYALSVVEINLLAQLAQLAQVTTEDVNERVSSFRDTA